MHYSDKIRSKLEERIKNCNAVIERELKIHGNAFDFLGHGLEMVKEEKGVIKIEPSEAGSRVSIWGEVALPIELVVMSDQLVLMNGELSFGIADSLERGRVIRYRVEDEIDFESEAEAEEDEEDGNDNEDKNSGNDEKEINRKLGGEGVKEISVNKNGEYPIDRGKIKSEDSGRKLTLSMEYVTLVIEGFGRERKMTYIETIFGGKKLIVEIRSRKEIEAIKRKEVLNEFILIAEEINGDRHGVARGVAHILHENEVKVVMPMPSNT
jgi:hypothetical protein